MTAQQLKNSILQMAVQGKLVPQDPSDEPASVLLERIKAEKQELIKAGKIKKDKKSSEIFRGAAHNLPYAYCEQIGKEIRDISDEIPFEIPDSWEWVRCSVLGAIIRGSGIKRTETVDSGLPCVRYGELYTTYNISFTKTVSFIPKELFEQCKQISYGDVIFTLTGENKPDIAKTIAYLGNSPVAVGGDLAYWTHHGMNPLYLVYFMSSPYAIGRKVNLATGDIIVHISGDKVGSFLIPVPPLAEQNRIVAKINELEPIIQEYHSKEKAVSALNTTFPEALKKSILQEAVQGKLVPQDPDDEPASVLLERIRVEKQKLIKAGKIKKSKHESVIVTRDKIPYEIPDSWVWCKLSDLAILENGDRSSKYPVEADYVEIGIPFFGAKDIDGDMMSFQNVRFISQQKYDELGNGKLVDGDIICLLRGSVGKTAKFEANEQFDTGFICAQMLIIRLLDKSLFGYISSYFKSPDYTNYVESKVTGTAVRQMPAKEMGNLLIPLPPLAEQHRIVAKIEEIMPMIERLTLR
ncbi:restriction endonuclease subunit S [Ruminococcus sp.]|uniref:restriction endonuclease subunit S n=1 Tax=Ruminococcus sp. TaxID=41978 RepID=UPI00257C495A|nr:restriction endonuclease subunit S [Ruminococcus sp.]